MLPVYPDRLTDVAVPGHSVVLPDIVPATDTGETLITIVPDVAVPHVPLVTTAL